MRQTGRRYDAGAFTLFFAPRRPPRPARAVKSDPTHSAPAPLSADAPPAPTPPPPTPAPAAPLNAEPEAALHSGAPRPPAPPPGPARAGFVASRSAVGGAVERARAKRRLREAFRAHQTAFPPGLDLIFVARRSLNRLEHAALQDRFSTLCRKLFPPRAA